MSSVLLSVGAIALCVGMLVAAQRIEPHWVSKDATRFLAMSEPVDRFGSVAGRRREVRATMLPDGGVMITQRSRLRAGSAVYRIQAKSPRPPAGRQVYVLEPIPPAADGSMLALRLPAKSAMVPVLDRFAPSSDGR